MTEQSAQTENTLVPQTSNTINDALDAISKSAFTATEACYKIDLPQVEPPNNSELDIASYEQLQAEIEQLKTANNALEQHANDISALHTEIDELKQQLEIADNNLAQHKQEADTHKSQLEELELKLKIANNKVCQCITANETQCTKIAYKAVKYNGLAFWICKQHIKHYPDAVDL